MDVVLYAEHVDDISPVSAESVEVTLSNVDVNQLVSEVGEEELLGAMDFETVEEYVREKNRQSDE